MDEQYKLIEATKQKQHDQETSKEAVDGVEEEDDGVERRRMEA